jgi:hypothetical protein
MALIFRCDICKEIADHNAMRFKIAEGRQDICKECLTHLDMCADLMKKPGFKDQLKDLHLKFFPENQDS